jgi:hypothetical protein
MESVGKRRLETFAAVAFTWLACGLHGKISGMEEKAWSQIRRAGRRVSGRTERATWTRGESKMRTWRTVIGVLLMVGSVPAIGGAQVAADAVGCGSEKDPCYSEEVGFCTDPTVGGGDVILSASEAYNEDIRVPCWVEVNTCKNCGQPAGGSVYALSHPLKRMHEQLRA